MQVWAPGLVLHFVLHHVSTMMIIPNPCFAIIGRAASQPRKPENPGNHSSRQLV